jgi:hypothetical protein
MKEKAFSAPQTRESVRMSDFKKGRLILHMKGERNVPLFIF